MEEGIGHTLCAVGFAVQVTEPPNTGEVYGRTLQHDYTARRQGSKSWKVAFKCIHSMNRDQD